MAVCDDFTSFRTGVDPRRPVGKHEPVGIAQKIVRTANSLAEPLGQRRAIERGKVRMYIEVDEDITISGESVFRGRLIVYRVFQGTVNRHRIVNYSERVDQRGHLVIEHPLTHGIAKTRTLRNPTAVECNR